MIQKIRYSIILETRIINVREELGMKYCGKCGRQMDDGDNFCPSCGAPHADRPVGQSFSEYADKQEETKREHGALVSASPSYTYDTSDGSRPMYTYDTQSAEQQFQNIYTQSTQQDKNTGMVRKKKPRSGRRLIPVFAAAAALMILFLVFFFRCVVGSGSLTKNGAVKAYYEALQTKDGEKLLDATVSNSMLDALEEKSGFTKKHIIRLMKAKMTASSTDGKYRHTKITDTEKYSKSDIEDVLDTLERQTGERISISAMCKVEIEYDSWNSYYEQWVETSGKLVLYKSGGNWYVFPDSLDF